MPGAEWYADLVSLQSFRQTYEEGFFHEDPVDLTVLADNEIVALVRRLAPMALQQHEPDDIGIHYHVIEHTDGEEWVLASCYSLELVPLGVFRSCEEAAAACVAMGYLVGNNGQDWSHFDSLTDEIILKHFAPVSE